IDSTRRRRQNAATGRVRRRSAGPGSSGDVLNVGALRHMNAMDFADETTVEFHSACAPVPGRGDGRADADFMNFLESKRTQNRGLRAEMLGNIAPTPSRVHS